MALPPKNALPSLKDTSFGLGDGAQGDKLDRESVIKMVLEGYNSKKNSGVDYLSSKVLLGAPKDFFNEYDEYVKQAVSALQDTIAQSDGGGAFLSAARKNREDKNLEAETFNRLDLEFTRFTQGMIGRTISQRLKDSYKQIIWKAMVINELMGLGPLEPLRKDDSITEIMCNGPYDVQVEIGGNIRRVESCHFRDADHLQKLIDVLYQSIDKSISRNNPMDRGRLSDNSRLMVVDRVVAPDGPNLNIRRHSGDYWGPADILNTGASDKELMTYLGNLIYNDVSFLIIGGTGSGKTTLLNALTAYYRPDARIVTLEDNLEMKPHPKKLIAAPMETVPSKPGSQSPGITMRDLVHASLQMRPEVIIIGEVTDGAAYDLCQALNTGHAGASTVHANSAEDGVSRLVSLVSQSELIKGRAALDLIGAAFDVVITVERLDQLDKSRKIVAVSELADRPTRNEENGEMELKLTPLWQFEANEELDENNKVTGKWVQVGELSEHTKKKHHLNLTKPMSWEELQRIARV